MKYAPAASLQHAPAVSLEGGRPPVEARGDDRRLDLATSDPHVSIDAEPPVATAQDRWNAWLIPPTLSFVIFSLLNMCVFS